MQVVDSVIVLLHPLSAGIAAVIRLIFFCRCHYYALSVCSYAATALAVSLFLLPFLRYRVQLQQVSTVVLVVKYAIILGTVFW